MHLDLSALIRASWETLTRMPPSLGRVLAITLGAATFTLFETFTWACLTLDDWLYPGYRRQRVDRPVFIVGNPRSGTSFFHRLLAADGAAFTGLTLQEILLPATCQQRAIAAAGRLDGALGRPLGRLIAWCEARMWAGADDIRRIRLSDPEEDELLLAHAFATPSLVMLFPGAASLLRLQRFDELPAGERRRWMDLYRALLQRHLYRAGGGRRLLSKNTTFPLKITSVAERFPDGHFLWLVRDPAASIASTLDMFDRTWRAQLDAEHAARMRDRLFDSACYLYAHALERLDRLPPSQVTVVRYEALIADPEGATLRVYERLGIAPGEAARRQLREAARRARGFETRHRYDGGALGVDPQRVRAALPQLYARFADAPWARDPLGASGDPPAGGDLSREEAAHAPGTPLPAAPPQPA